VHPGYADTELQKKRDPAPAIRQIELEILTDKTIRKIIAELGIRLINYQQIGV